MTIKFKGICCTYDRDLQGEIIKKDGIEIKDVNHLCLEYLHNPENILGKVTKITVEDDGIHVEGELFSKNEKAKIIQSNQEISCKFSLAVEGKIKGRNKEDDRIIEKAEITGVSLTQYPANKHCSFEIIKDEK